MTPHRFILPVGFTLFALFLVLPLVLVIVAAFSPEPTIRFPPTGASLRWFAEVLSDPVWIHSFFTSLVVALIVASSCTLACAAAVVALGPQRGEVTARRWLGMLAILPLLLPHVSFGIAMLAFSRRHGLGGSLIAIVVAHAVLVLPFAWRPVVTSFDKLDAQLGNAAMVLGARPAQAFWTVLLPCLRPGLLTAFIFTFVTSFDEATVTLFLVGPEVTTLPIRVLIELQQDGSPAVAAASVLMILMTLGVVLMIEKVTGLAAFAEMERSR
ncbi:MAG: ABC transporter permease subunit [Acetobacteraceae bacterium]|nr:ABC transporter permease subunit [Acetobacteraceae bacterium]